MTFILEMLRSLIQFLISKYLEISEIFRGIRNYLEISKIEMVISKIELVVSLNYLQIWSIEVLLSLIQLLTSWIRKFWLRMKLEFPISIRFRDVTNSILMSVIQFLISLIVLLVSVIRFNDVSNSNFWYQKLYLLTHISYWIMMSELN